MIRGITSQVIRTPPAKKQQVATSDGHWRFASPVIEWPEVQPFAYRVPNPTRNPPTTIRMNPLSVRSEWKLKNSVGWRPVKS
jgi:hypothetical protein